MPQFQIISRQPDRTVEALQNAGQAAQDALTQQQNLKLKKLELDIQAKNTQNESDKMKYARQSQMIDTLFKLRELNADPQKSLGALVRLYGETVLSDMADLGNAILGSPETASEQLKKAQATQAQSAAVLAPQELALQQGQLSARQAELQQQLDLQDPAKLQARIQALTGGLGGVGGGNLPPGTALNVDVGGAKLNLPLNPSVSPEAARTVASTDIIAQAIGELNTAVDSGTLNNFISQAIVDLGNPVLAPKNLDSIISSMNALKSIIPFAKGGKQLTPFEANLLFRLLDTKGKSPEIIKKDLGRFQTEFNRLRSSILGGSAGAGGTTAPAQPAAGTPISVGKYKVTVKP